MNCSGCNHIYKPLVNWILFWVTYRNSMICHLSIVHQNRPVVSYSIHSSSRPASKLWRPFRSKHARRRLVKWDTSMRSGWQGSHHNGQDLIKCKKEKFGDRSWSGITMIDDYNTPYTRVLNKVAAVLTKPRILINSQAFDHNFSRKNPHSNHALYRVALVRYTVDNSLLYPVMFLQAFSGAFNVSVSYLHR